MLDGDHYVAHRDELRLEPREVRIAGVVTTSLHDAIEDARRETRSSRTTTPTSSPGTSTSPARSSTATSSASSTSGSTSRRRGRAARRNLGPGRILAAHYNGGGGVLGDLLREPSLATAATTIPTAPRCSASSCRRRCNFSRISSSYTNARFHPILHHHAAAPGHRLRGAGRHARSGPSRTAS